LGDSGALAKTTDQIAVNGVLVGKDVSASSNLLPIKEFFFNLTRAINFI
jgi:hypothetical protein